MLLKRSVWHGTCLLVLVIICLSYIYLYNHIVEESSWHHQAHQIELIAAPTNHGEQFFEAPDILQFALFNSTTTTGTKRALILTLTRHSPAVLELLSILDFNHIDYKLAEWTSSNSHHKRPLKIPLLSSSTNRLLYSLVVIDSLPTYVTSQIRHDCARHRIGILHIGPRVRQRPLDDEPPPQHKTPQIIDASSCRLTDSQIAKTTRIEVDNTTATAVFSPVDEIESTEEGDDLLYNVDALDPIWFPVVQCGGDGYLVMRTRNETSHLRVVAVSSPRRVNRLAPALLLDILDYVSYGRLGFSLDRYVQIDVDDVFVAKTGLRMRPDDVVEMMRFQDEYLNARVFTSLSSSSPFKFNLGFSGYYFSSGSQEENLADQLLIGCRFSLSLIYL